MAEQQSVSLSADNSQFAQLRGLEKAQSRKGEIGDPREFADIQIQGGEGPGDESGAMKEAASENDLLNELNGNMD